MNYIKTANGVINNTPKHAFYIDANKKTIKWSKTIKEKANQRYQLGIPTAEDISNGFTGLYFSFFDKGGYSFKQKKAINVVPIIAQKYPDTNNFGYVEVGDNLFEIVPLKPRVFVAPSAETISKAQIGLQTWREEQAEQEMEKSMAYDGNNLTDTQTVEVVS